MLSRLGLNRSSFLADRGSGWWCPWWGWWCLSFGFGRLPRARAGSRLVGCGVDLPALDHCHVAKGVKSLAGKEGFETSAVRVLKRESEGGHCVVGVGGGQADPGGLLGDGKGSVRGVLGCKCLVALIWGKGGSGGAGACWDTVEKDSGPFHIGPNRRESNR